MRFFDAPTISYRPAQICARHAKIVDSLNAVYKHQAAVSFTYLLFQGFVCLLWKQPVDFLVFPCKLNIIAPRLLLLSGFIKFAFVFCPPRQIHRPGSICSLLQPSMAGAGQNKRKINLETTKLAPTLMQLILSYLGIPKIKFRAVFTGQSNPPKL